MYDNKDPDFSDFEFVLDDLLIARLIDPAVFKQLTPESYSVLRATLRSEMLYSEEVGKVIRAATPTLLKRAKSMVLAGKAKMPAAKVAAKRKAIDAGPSMGGAPAGGGLVAMMYAGRGGGRALRFEDVLLERYLPAQTRAALTPDAIAAFTSMIKAEFIFNSKVHTAVKKRLVATVRELSRK